MSVLGVMAHDLPLLNHQEAGHRKVLHNQEFPELLLVVQLYHDMPKIVQLNPNS